MLLRIKKIYYFCKCDECGRFANVEESKDIYNGAQAVRSLGWSFGRDKKVFCSYCRQSRICDQHRWCNK